MNTLPDLIVNGEFNVILGFTCKHKEGSACSEIVNGFIVQYTLIFTNHIMEDVMQKLKYDTSCDSKATKVPKILK